MSRAHRELVLALREYIPVHGSAGRIATLFFFGLIGMASGSYLGGLVYDLTGAYRPAFLMGVTACPSSDHLGQLAA